MLFGRIAIKRSLEEQRTNSTRPVGNSWQSLVFDNNRFPLCSVCVLSPLFVRLEFSVQMLTLSPFRRPYLLFSPPIAASLAGPITRRVTRSLTLRCNIHATSCMQFAVSADFVRIGYLSAVWGAATALSKYATVGLQ